MLLERAFVLVAAISHIWHKIFFEKYVAPFPALAGSAGEKKDTLDWI